MTSMERAGTARDTATKGPTTLAERHLRLLVSAGDALSSAEGLEETVAAVARMAVPAFADFCLVRVMAHGDGLAPMAVAHVDGDAGTHVQVAAEPAADASTNGRIVRELRGQRPLLVEDVGRYGPREPVHGSDPLQPVRARAHGPGIVAPLLVHGEPIGLLAFGGAGGRRFDASDVPVARELARQAAAALDNARLREQERRAREGADAAHLAYEESLALLDTLLVSAPVGLAFWDRRLRYVRVNDALAEMDGIPAKEHVGRHITEVVPDIAGAVGERLSTVLDTGQPIINVEVSGRTPAAPDEVRYWLTSYYPVTERGGSLLGAGAVFSEITDRKRAEQDRERLYRDLREFRATLDTTRDSVYIFDPGTLRFRYVNRGAIESTGYSREELLRMSPVDLKPEYDEARFRQLLGPLLGDPESSATISTSYRRKDGRTYPVEISLQYVQPPQEQGRVVAIVRDITDRVEARARLQRLAQSERALNAELKAIIRAMGDAVLVLDARGRVVLANPSAATIFQSGPIQHYDDLLRGLDDPDQAVPRLGDTEPQGPVELHVRDEADRWLEVSAYPVFTPSDVVRETEAPAEVLETILFLRDVTELRRSRVARDAFIGVLSHELRTPVTTIFGNSKLLGRTERTLPSASRRDLIRDIETEAERLYRLVEDLLVLARYGEDAGKDVANEPILLQRVVPSVIRSEQSRFPGVRFEPLIPANLPAVEGDQTYVEQVVRNLLSNAAKYGGGDGARVTVVLESGEAEASVRVLDEGPGFDDAETGQLFELFYRSQRAQARASGAGIGLFVCRRLVEAMGGRIWARPRRAGGAEFGFVLKLFFEEDV
jgi:PAS domain S-box-containing protein